VTIDGYPRPIRNQRVVMTKSEWAYKEVRKVVLEGELKPGATVNQEEHPLAVGLATQRMTPERVVVVTRLARAHVRGGATAIVEANREFHRAVYSASGNSFLTRTLDQLWGAADRYRLALISEHESVVPRSVDDQP
jgi:DNA-binding GntR family transcriptional regulator